MEKRGFTLVELAFVLAIIGILVAMTVPAFDGIVGRARAVEARTTLEAIVHAEHAWRRDHGSYLALPAAPASVPKGTEVPFEAGDPWRRLGVAIEGTVRYQYSVTLDGTTFHAVAAGDLDGDGAHSRFTMRGDTLELVVENEGE